MNKRARDMDGARSHSAGPRGPGYRLAATGKWPPNSWRPAFLKKMVAKLPSVYMKPMSMDERRVFSYLTSSLLSSYTSWSFWCECACFLARYHLRRAGA